MTTMSIWGRIHTNSAYIFQVAMGVVNQNLLSYRKMLVPVGKWERASGKRKHFMYIFIEIRFFHLRFKFTTIQLQLNELYQVSAKAYQEINVDMEEFLTRQHWIVDVLQNGQGCFVRHQCAKMGFLSPKTRRVTVHKDTVASIVNTVCYSFTGGFRIMNTIVV
jgi:hypothetical protein